MNEDDYQFNLRAVRESLAIEALKYELLPGLFYRSAFDFVLLEGREYRPVQWPFKYERGEDRQCYGNSIKLAAQFGLKYVEGVALSPSGELFLHGWNATDAGELVDSTWLNTGMVYLGVEFSLERADDATWNGDSHVLNDEAHGYPVFQKPWQGEDYGLTWPFSDRIECYRLWRETGIYHPPPSVVQWLRERAKPQDVIIPWRTPTV